MKPSLIGLILLCLANGAVRAQINALPPTRHILVYGEAQARAVPDRFKIQVMFATTDASAEVARQRVEANLQRAIVDLKAASVAEREIVATSLQIAPSNEYDASQQKQIYRGIRVARSLSARFRDQASLKRFLAGLETSEEVQVSGVTTELSAEPELRRQLRRKAIESTREKAAVIAKAYGVRLAGLYSVSDTAPEFKYGVVEGIWPTTYEWNRAGKLDEIEMTGGYAAPSGSRSESFQVGYVDFSDKIYAVFLLADERAPSAD